MKYITHQYAFWYPYYQFLMKPNITVLTYKACRHFKGLWGAISLYVFNLSLSNLATSLILRLPSTAINEFYEYYYYY